MGNHGTAAGRRGRRRRGLAWVFGLGVLASALVMPAATAQQNGGARLDGGPEFPTAGVKVGDKGVPVDFLVRNDSSHSFGKVTIAANTITLTLSCGTFTPGATEPCSNPDPGVFATGATGTGRAGTNCAGQTYSIVPVPGPTGEVQFNGPAIVLSATDASDVNGGVCFIDFTVDVLKAPATDAVSSLPGIQTAQLADAPGAADLGGAPAGCCGSSFTSVNLAAPALTTQASPPVTLGGTISDTATLSGGVTPTGSVTFTFYAPADTTCAAAPVFTSPAVAVKGAGSYTSAPYTPTVTGTFRTIASYSGDSNNLPVKTKCNDNGESVVVSAVPSSPSPARTPTPATTVLGTSTTRKPILPVTGPGFPAGPLGLLAVGLIAAGGALLRRSRRRTAQG